MAQGFRSILIGVDGSPHARRAVSFVARLRPPRGGRVAVIRVVEPMRLPTLALLPAGVRGEIARQASALHARRVEAARRDAQGAAARLAAAGWRASGSVRVGVPLDELLRAIGPARADLLVLGARGVGGVTRFLLGSVAESAAKRSPIAVLIVR